MVVAQLRLVQQTGIQHLVHPQVDAAVELGAVGEIQPQHQRTIGPLGREGLGFLFTQTLAGGAEVLQRPQHPHLIVRVDGGSGLRVGLLKLFVHGFRAFFGQLGGQLLPQAIRRLFGGKVHTI